MLLKGRTGGIATLATYFISYAAVASSSSANVYAMRCGEMTSGVSVKDEATDTDYGLSKIAATSGINQTMLCRWTYAIPIFFVPAAWSTLLTKLSIMPKKLNLARVILETIGVTMGLFVAMPVNCALFAQQSRILVKDLEPEIQERVKDKNLTYLTFNKGL